MVKHFFHIKRLFAFAFAICMIFSMVACTVERPEPVYDTRLNLLSTNGVSIYSVVRADLGCSNEIRDASVKLRDGMQVALGTEVTIATDFEADKDADFSLRYEILVGPTNRPESDTAKEGLERDEFVVRVIGHKIVIIGESDRATVAGVDYFLKDVLHYTEGMEPLGEQAKLEPDYFYRGTYIFESIKNEVDTLVTCAKYQAKTLFQVSMPGNSSDALTLGTLQGLVANLSSEQILVKAGALSKYSTYLKSEWNVTIKPQNDEGKEWNLDLLLAYFGKNLAGYILCNEDLSSESAGVAVSMAGQMNAVVVTPANKAKAEAVGLTCLYDVSEKDDAWFRTTEYFEKCSRKLAVEQSVSLAPKLIDYAVMAGCYIYFYNGNDGYTHDQKFKFLDDGAVVIGWNNTLGEYETVSSFSRQNVQMIPADHAYNLSTLSGFSKATMTPKKAAKADGTVDGAKHTVCFVMSDGDNMQWTLNDYTTSNRWYGSTLRGDFPMAWGLPATLADLAAPMMSYFYNSMTIEDEFIMELSGLGYTFPSKWTEDARADLAQNVAKAMKRSNMKYMEILDDKGFNANDLYEFAVQKEIEGIFYIDYSNYAGEKGKILWIDGTPVVSARYRLWAGLKDGEIDYIADKINAASTDPTSEDAYSFVIVHAWSGLNDEGDLVGSGLTMNAVEELISHFDTDVDVVSASEFMARLKENVKK